MGDGRKSPMLSGPPLVSQLKWDNLENADTGTQAHRWREREIESK